MSAPLADVLIEFVQTFDSWSRRTAVSSAQESVPRLRLLYELHCNGPRRMADLADALGVTPRNVTALVDGLESEHLVRRLPHPTDRRVTMVEMGRRRGGRRTNREFRIVPSRHRRLWTGCRSRTGAPWHGCYQPSRRGSIDRSSASRIRARRSGQPAPPPNGRDAPAGKPGPTRSEQRPARTKEGPSRDPR